MNFPPPENERLTIIVTGSFNPAILQPSWFASEKLIRQGEAEAPENLVVTKDYTSFSLEWMVLQARTDRLDVFSEDPGSFALVRDLVIGIFLLLRHTPVTALQIMNHAHFGAKSTDDWHLVGDTLAPKALYEGILKRPGLLMLQLQDQRFDDREGTVLVDIEPSQRIKPGVYLAVCDTYKLAELSDKDSVDGIPLLNDILTQDWSSSMIRRRGTMTTILDRV